MATSAWKWPRRDFLIHPSTQLGPVHLNVADIDRQIDFYAQVLGMKVHWRNGKTAGLGAGQEVLLKLTELVNAKRASQTTGLYHFALLYPNRRELARVIARLFQRGYPNYPTDHVVSKTTYLDDAEGNTIELYVYSPKDGKLTLSNGKLEAWWADGRPSNVREPLDLEALFSHLKPDEELDVSMPQPTIIGHVHLYASSLEESMDFYSKVLGFRPGGIAQDFRMGDVTMDRPHVIAFNTWLGEGITSPPDGSLGLRYFTIELPNADALHAVTLRVKKAGIDIEVREGGIRVRDPSGIVVQLQVR